MSNLRSHRWYQFSLRMLLLTPVSIAALCWWAMWPDRTHLELRLGAVVTLLIVIIACMNAGMSRTLAFFANATLIYPLILLGLLYSEWLLAWYLVGHPPSPFGDEPELDGDWMWPVTAIAVLGIMPVGFAALICNLVYIAKNRSSAAQIAIRISTLVGLWLGMFVTMFADPYKVWTWWFD